MANLYPYLNFNGNTEEAFLFYKSVFGGEFTAFQRFKDVPDSPNFENMSESDKEKIMHVVLPIGNHGKIMATDVLTEMGQTEVSGNNISLSIDVENLAEGHHIFDGLSVGGKIEMPFGLTFWGAYFGILIDKFGIQWMVNCDNV